MSQGVCGIRLTFDPVTRSFVPVGKGLKRFVGQFIPPIPAAWFQVALRLPRKALAVGMIIRREAAMSRQASFALTGPMVKKWGIGPDTKLRALRALEAAGLIKLQIKPRHNPIVTIIEIEER